jgi:transmembrane sensor
MDSPKSELKNLGEAIRDAFDADAHPTEQIRTARSALLERVAARNAASARPGWLRRSGRPGLRLWGGLGALGLLGAVGLAGAAVFAIWTRLPISFQVGAAGSAGRLGDVVEAADGLPVALRFSEGSAVVLGAGGRARVLSAESAGARVLVESGAVDVAIVHRRLRTHWSFEAGPFHVLVTGTKFRLDWNPKDQSLGLSTREGSVLVSGGCLAEAHAVRAGETVHWSCQSLAAAPTPVSVANAPSAAPTPAPAPGKRFALLSEPAAHADAWRELLANGHLADGLRAAERADFGRVCRTAGESDLLALADAARLSGHTARAVQALVALRQRFPRSPDAATAAFSLGRIAFERRGAYPEAVRWFSAYLAELPQGPLMGDAVGRLMEARQRAGDRTAARADAARYLQRFPEGPYAPEARVMLSE